MAKCQHCSESNPEGFFNCPSCGNKATKSKWSTNTFIRHGEYATAIRKDLIDFGTKDMNEHIKETKKKNDISRDKKINSHIKWK
jgi:RNA polymerase subunit RPABC4/transcription elongation factor Spt4|tara:strand:+ start:848 stop:1099 length:252 start_codon:yes stop_codon:yes gene_type:complete